MTRLFTNLVRHTTEKCRFCERPSDDGYFGDPYVQTKRGCENIHVHSICRICFEMELAISEAKVDGRRFTIIGVGSNGISSYEGDRCICGCVTHARLNMCVRCSKDNRMLTAMQAKKKFTDRLLKELKAQIKSTLKENQNAN